MLIKNSKNDLKILFLGNFKIILKNNTVASLAYIKMRALLAYLVVEQDQTFTRDFLAELFWGNENLSMARASLRRALSDLRKALEVPSDQVLFVATKDTLRFIPNVYVDVLYFMGKDFDFVDDHDDFLISDEQRVLLYQGEFLRGLVLPECEEFMSWLQHQRIAYHCRAVILLEKLTSHYQNLKKYPKALQFATRLADIEPWNETAHSLLIMLYAFDGQISAALHQYELCRQILKTELDTQPQSSTQQLIAAIQQRGMLPLDVNVEPTIPASDTIVMELRQVTVLYIEFSMVGIEEADVEESLPILRSLHAHGEQLIKFYQGFLVPIHGGGVLAYFGYPNAQEHAVRKAVHVALAMSEKNTAQVKVTCVVHTGLLVSKENSQIPDVSGQLTKQTMHLLDNERIATVLISQISYDVAGRYFDCTLLGERVVLGEAQKITLYAVHQESNYLQRNASHLTPLIGRQQEMTTLVQLWQTVQLGASQSVVIEGDAGMGKTRLITALVAHVAASNHKIFMLRGQQEFSQTPYYPLLQMLKGWLGLSTKTTPEVSLATLLAYLQKHSITELDEYTCKVLADLLCLSEPYEISKAECRKVSTHKASIEKILYFVLHRQAQAQAIVFIVEDAHCLDIDTQAILRRFHNMASNGCFMLFTIRTGQRKGVKKLPNVRLTLLPLKSHDALKMLHYLDSSLPEQAVQRIIASADGVPLYLEALSKLATTQMLPASLRDSLAVRIDGLGRAKKTLQLAATIGREFDSSWLHYCRPSLHNNLAEDLQHSLEAGVLTLVKKNIYQFKDTLTQEAAYQSQTKEDRRRVHHELALMLQKNLPEVVEHYPEQIAQHLSAAQAQREALWFWLKAGLHATQNAAYQKAIDYYYAGLHELTTLTKDPVRERMEYILYTSFEHLPDDKDAYIVLNNIEAILVNRLGAVLLSTHGYSSKEAPRMFARALVLCEEIGDRNGRFKALWGLCLINIAQHGAQNSLTEVEQLFQLAEHNKHTIQRQLAQYVSGYCHLKRGDLSQAADFLEAAMCDYQPHHHQEMLTFCQDNTYLLSGGLLVLVWWSQNKKAEALHMYNSIMRAAHTLHHSPSYAGVLCLSIVFNSWMKRYLLCDALAKQALALANQYDLAFTQKFVQIWQGIRVITTANPDDTESLMLLIDNLDSEAGSGKIIPLLWLIDRLYDQGLFDKALTYIDAAIVNIEHQRDYFLASEVYRLQGQCLFMLATPELKKITQAWRRALQIARQQQAYALEQRVLKNIHHATESRLILANLFELP